MRKRIVIGAIAAALIGVAGYALSQPKKGTVEWHKREYLALRYLKPPLKGRISMRLMGRDPYASCLGPVRGDERAMAKHLSALENLGYLQRPVTVRTGGLPATTLRDALVCDAYQALPADHVWWIGTSGGNSLDVLCEPRDVETFKRLIRVLAMPMVECDCPDP